MLIEWFLFLPRPCLNEITHIMEIRILTTLLMQCSCHSSSLKKKKMCLTLPVLFHLNFFFLSLLTLISLCGRAATKTTMPTTPVWGQTARNQGWKRLPLLPSLLLCPWAFLGRNAFHISQEPWSCEYSFSWKQRQKVPASLMAGSHSHSENQAFLPLPVSAVPTPSLKPNQDR